MKFIKVLIIFLSLISLYKTARFRTDSILEFYNNFLNSDTLEDTAAPVPAPATAKPPPSATAAPGAAPGAGTNATDEFSLIKEDWLKISTPSFNNPNIFPPIFLTNGSVAKIQFDDRFFRINPVFNNSTQDDNLPRNNTLFWFRLSGKSLYYADTKTDMNVLGAILTENLVDARPLSDYGNENTCFQIDDIEKNNWKLCANTTKRRNKWICKIKEIKKINSDLCNNLTLAKLNLPTVIENIINQPIILIPLPSRTCNEDWNYLNKGQDWECTCSEGREQSPIDLPPKDKSIHSPIKPLFQYEEVQAKLDITSVDGQLRSTEFIKIKNIENSLSIFHKFFGKIVTLDGAVYNAEEIVFHTPSEHTINGVRYDMEMQIIHYGQTKGDIANQVVFSFLFEKKPGVYNKFIDDIDYFNLPNPISKEREINKNLFIPRIFYSSDDNDLPILRPFSFYTYQGSIPFPPCTERTIVYVAAKPIPLGSTAIQMFQEALRVPDLQTSIGDIITSNASTENNRNVQPLLGRIVFYFDHIKYCGEDLRNSREPIKSIGHYEKQKKTVTDYFYVTGENPSGLPGALLVSEGEARGTNLK